jgi:hypothetical protein
MIGEPLFLVLGEGLAINHYCRLRRPPLSSIKDFSCGPGIASLSQDVMRSPWRRLPVTVPSRSLSGTVILKPMPSNGPSSKSQVGTILGTMTIWHFRLVLMKNLQVKAKKKIRW